jgi:uncharacterized SAM-binding protein YcdF (DUF218 family)
MSDYSDWLIPSPLYLILLLLVLTLLAFRPRSKNGLRRYRWVLVITLAWSWIFATPVVANQLLLALEGKYTADADAAIEPGSTIFIAVLASGDAFDASRDDEYQLDAASMRRSLAAARLWKEHGGRVVFFGSGFQSEGLSIAARMAKLAHATGVPFSHIDVHPASFTTHQNIVSLVELPIHDETVFLVTSAAHMPRAMGVARRYGLQPLPHPCDFRARYDLGVAAWLPDSKAIEVLRYVLHERIGLAYYRLRGWSVAS